MLRASGIPESLLSQMKKNGIQADYLNTWIGASFLDPRYNPQLPTNQLDSPDAAMAIRRTIGATRTYSDYWKNRIEMYNQRALEHGSEIIDPDTAFDLLATQQPQTRSLDSLARQANDLIVDETIASPALVMSYVKLAAQAYMLIDGDKKEAMKLLRKFGLLDKRESEKE
jgi:hypothetical protein